jgi:hypothetical protein
MGNLDKTKVNILNILKNDLGLNFSHGEMTKDELDGTNRYIDVIKYIDSLEPLPDFEAYLNLYDEVPSEDELNERNIDKLLVMSKSVNDNHDRYKLCSLWGLQLFDKIDKILNNQVQWSDKISKACWFGSTTGDIRLWAKNPQFTRYQLIRESLKRGDLINAGFTSIVQYAKSRPEKFRNNVLKTVPHQNSYEQMKYKYIVVADGNVSTFGLFWVLASGSVTLKQDSEYIQYFEDNTNTISKDFENPDLGMNGDRLKPNVHYVPVKRDFSDLHEKIEWLKEHPKEAQEITNNARSFAQRHFNLEAFVKQLRNVLTT